MRSRSSFYVAALLAIGYMIFVAANLSFAGTVNLPKTGQTTCYDAVGNVIPCAATGQDGDIQAGVGWPAPRFTSNGDGTITDHLTGLMWLKNANCFGTMTWQEALDKVADLNTNPGGYTCGGYSGAHTDWVLPNVNELESLCNAEVPNSAAWLNTKGFVDVKSSRYWSSTTLAIDVGGAWSVEMTHGYVGSESKSTCSYYVWPVRAVTTIPAAILKTGQTQSYAVGDDGTLQRGVAWPSPRFTEHPDGTVTDNLTGLMWLTDANCFGGMTWQEAFDKVADLNANPGGYSCAGYTAAYTDWRLPNRKELYSLTDFSQADPSLPQGHPFVSINSWSYRSSSTVASMSVYSWGVSMSVGGVNLADKSQDYWPVWPVRTEQTGPLVNLDIKANGQDGPIIVSPSTPVAIDISIDPGGYVGQNAEWWIVVQWPFGMFWNYYSYVYPTGWLPGINRCIEMPLTVLGSTNVLTTTLPPAEYEFFFLIDERTWMGYRMGLGWIL